LLLLALLLASLQGCSLLPEVKDKTEGWSANQLYTEGKDSLRKGDYEQAIEYFETLQARYPFGRYAQQAMLETAFAYYKFDEADQALAALDRFIRTYPRHPFVDYAYYLKGLVNFYRTTSIIDRVVPRDPTRTDTKAARQSYRDFEELVKRFPDSKYTNDAGDRMRFLHNNLATYEVNVADYYMRRGAYVAAANRGRYVLETYALAPAAEDAIAIMAQAYIKLGMYQLAYDAARVLRANVPDSEYLPTIDKELATAGWTPPASLSLQSSTASDS
jgi:outer membrane protein assembly factor BamD